MFSNITWFSLSQRQAEEKLRGVSQIAVKWQSQKAFPFRLTPEPLAAPDALTLIPYLILSLSGQISARGAPLPKPVPAFASSRSLDPTCFYGDLPLAPPLAPPLQPEICSAGLFLVSGSGC